MASERHEEEQAEKAFSISDKRLFTRRCAVTRTAARDSNGGTPPGHPDVKHHAHRALRRGSRPGWHTPDLP
jgi:hypothetical protein